MKIIKVKNLSNEKGFSYIDVMIAIVIMLVGVLAMASALTANLIRSYETEKIITAKQIGLSTIESIIAARNIKRPDTTVEGWAFIGNEGNNMVEGSARGIFLNGWRPIREDLGLDGVAGTADDACTGTGACTNSDGSSNDSPVKNSFERKIEITDVQDPDRPSPPNAITRRKITITVRYFINTLSRQQEIKTLVTNY